MDTNKPKLTRSTFTYHDGTIVRIYRLTVQEDGQERSFLFTSKGASVNGKPADSKSATGGSSPSAPAKIAY